MNYKKIFRSEKTRAKILRFLGFIPDKPMVKLQYRIKTGRKLDLKEPVRYSEKLQWIKLFYRDADMCRCANKATVRRFVEERGCGEILNECYGVYDRAEDVDFDALPDSFVLKDTLGGGGRSMIFVTDKSALDKDAARATMNEWVSADTKGKNGGREWVYYGQKHQIIAEKLLISGDDGDLPDYKFFCFDGKVFCSYMMQNYTQHHELGVLGFLDRDFKLLKAHRKDFAPMLEQPEKPIGYEKMVEYAERLSKGFPHVRVDFYNLSGKIIFGEMTFFNASGYVEFEPDEFDAEMGSRFTLPEKNV